MSLETPTLLLQIGRNLRAERARRELTQEAVSRLTGIATTQLARMERGETDSGISKYVRVASALDISPEDLFRGVDLRSMSRGGRERAG